MRKKTTKKVKPDTAVPDSPAKQFLLDDSAMVLVENAALKQQIFDMKAEESRAEINAIIVKVMGRYITPLEYENYYIDAKTKALVRKDKA